MFERESRLFGLMITYCRQLTDDLADHQLHERAAPGANSPGWILGHLAVATDYALRLLGHEPQCPESWHRRFGMGSTPPPSASEYPSKAELLGALSRGHELTCAAAAAAPADRLREPHGSELFKRTPVQTVGDLVAHLMTTHIAMHLGQLSFWRRLNGRPPLF